jgi:hypothetical protein
MTIQECRELKDKLESDIYGLIYSYQNTTGLKVESIKVDREDSFSADDNIILVSVKVNL